MYLHHFGLTHDPLGSAHQKWVEPPQYAKLQAQCDWLLQTKGVGVIYGEAGTGKTSALRHWTKSLNPHTHRFIYQADNHFPSFDIYSQLANSLGLEYKHRYSDLWRMLKQEIVHLHDDKKFQLIWILDEAQQLSTKFLSELPAFLNYAFDSRNMMTIILAGLPTLRTTLNKKMQDPLVSRVSFQYQWQPIESLEAFDAHLKQAFANAGKHDTIISDSGVNLMFMASKGRLRHANKILTHCLQLACQQALNHLPDDIISAVIDDIKNLTLA